MAATELPTHPVGQTLISGMKYGAKGLSSAVEILSLNDK